MPTTFQVIGYTSLTTSATTVAFTSIPATYTDLKIVAFMRGTLTSNTYFVLGFSLNSVGATDSSYRNAGIEGFGNSINPTALTSSSRSGFPIATSSGATATPTNLFGVFEFYLPNYTSSNVKTFSNWGNTVANITNRTYTTTFVNSWNNTAAVTSIEFVTTNSTGNFATNSSFTLYGIKRA